MVTYWMLGLLHRNSTSLNFVALERSSEGVPDMPTSIFSSKALRVTVRGGGGPRR
jgi:hypothetical protein